MFNFKTLFFLLNITFITLLTVWTIWVCNSYKFKKGDPVVSPPYKWTFYDEKHIISDYDFTFFFNKIKYNIKQNKTIDYYKWFLYYDEDYGFVVKAELFCYYKIKTRKKVLNFEADSQIFYTDKTKITHLCIDLVAARHVENILSAELYKKNNGSKYDVNDLETIYTKKGLLIGYNIKKGYLQYEIIIIKK